MRVRCELQKLLNPKSTRVEPWQIVDPKALAAADAAMAALLLEEEEKAAKKAAKKEKTKKKKDAKGSGRVGSLSF